MSDFDLFVIGAGSGGVRAARMAASFGAKVAVAEEQFMGGTCVNVGCVPKKLYVYGSTFGESFEDARGFGWAVEGASFDWNTLRDNKKREIKRLNGIYENLLNNAGCTLLSGRAKILGAQEVEVAGKKYSAKKILIATGGWPFVPEFSGSELAITSNEVFDLEKFPEKVIVVGGGYIAVEFAGIFAGLGAQTTQVYRGPLFLRNFDQDVREFVAEEIQKKKVNLKFDTNIKQINRLESGELEAELEGGEKLVADAILYATGRKPNLTNLGLENVSVELNKNGSIKVNQKFQTTEASVYALGDVTGGIELTPVALAEGMNFARREYNSQDESLDYENIPTAVFCQPNIGTVGLTEQQAREKYTEIEIYRSSFRPMKHTMSGRGEKTLMKLITDKQTDKVIGIHMVGEDAGEIIQGLAVAIKAGATKAQFDATIGIHPTAAEEFVTMREPVTD